MSTTGYKHTADAKRRIGDATRGKTCQPGTGKTLIVVFQRELSSKTYGGE